MNGEPDGVCPATVCPYMGQEVQEKGSPWTGERESDCEGDACGWWRDGGCLVSGELVHELIDRADMDTESIEFEDESQWVDCQYSDNCQWQSDTSPYPCPPRLAVLLNMDPSNCLY